jgi:hypothetical protein
MRYNRYRQSLAAFDRNGRNPTMSIVYDFTVGPPDPAPTGDERIKWLFREWQRFWRSAEFAQPLIDAIVRTPSSGVGGLAIKTFLMFRAPFDGADADDGMINEAMSMALYQDVMRLVAYEVPELAVVLAPLAPADDDEEAQPT